MPTLRRYRLSVAPVDMVGMTGSPGHMATVTRSTVPMNSVVNGEGGLGLGGATIATAIWSSASTRTRVCSTSSIESLGSTRQFTVALAVWGSALLAWPPLIRVATQVVRSWAL